MRLHVSDKTRLAALVIAVFSMVVAGCASNGSGGSSNSKNSSASKGGGKEGSRTRNNISDGEYYSANWLNARGYDKIDPALLPQKNAPIVRSSRGVPLGGGAASGGSNPPTDDAGSLPPPAAMGAAAVDGPVPPLPSEVAAQPSAGVWSLVLATFTEGDTTEAAKRMIAETARIAPDVRNMRVHPTARGVMVVYGEYASREDKKAQDDRTWLKSIKYENRPVFPRIALTHLDLRPLQADLHPYDLHMARRNHEKVHPLYTLDIAVWDDFDSGKLQYEDIRSAAERYARQLRGQGFEAYFFHDDVAKRSQVTVGLFDKRAINEISGLYNDAVMELIKTFPQRLANGEPQFDYADRFRPEMGTKPLTPVLVEVPDM